MNPLWILLLLACDGSSDDDSDTDDPSATATDTEPGTDTDTATAEGLMLREGSLAYDGSGVSGTETFRLIDPEGDEDESFCEISAEVSGSTALDSCDECDWAFSVTFSKVLVVADVDGACDAVGMDAAARAELEGAERDYGYSPEHFGHAQVLMNGEDGVWEAVANASYEEGTLTYTWDLGLVTY